MRKSIMGCLGVVAAIFVAQFALAEAKAGECISGCDPCAEVACDPCEPICGDFDTSCDSLRDLQCDPCGSNLFGCKPKKSRWNWGGHLEAGLFVNEYGRKNAYTPWDMGPTYGSGNTALLKNVHNADAQMNQMYFFGERVLDTRRGWDFGGKVSFMYGTDARFLQAQGMEYGAGHGGPDHQGRWNSGDYYSALPEAYFEVGYKKLSVKIGKFITPMGHNGVLSTDRFFYSLSDAFGLLPITHTGAVATWKFNKKFSVFGGWVNGEDNFCDTSDDNAFLGGANYKYSDRLSFAYSVLLGKNDRNDQDKDYFVQSFVVNYKPGKRWDYVFEWTLRNQKEPGMVYTGGYGINNELIYKLNKKWSVGARAEWSHVYYRGFGEDKYSFSLGANWTPRSWLVIRPELRYDKLEHVHLFAEKGERMRDKQLSGGFSAIVKF